MDKLEMIKLLDREKEEKLFMDSLNHFEANKQNCLTKRGIYVYGNPGTGKTHFVYSTLKKMNYDIIKYDAGDVRNKNVIKNLTKNNMTDRSVISMFQKVKKKIVIVMDEIDGMNNGDKGGINSLIKLIRPKKTKKQKKEETTMIPIICIGNYHKDKKIKEIIKICVSIELKTPEKEQIKSIICLLMPQVKNKFLNVFPNFIQGDLRKLSSIYQIYVNNKMKIDETTMNNLFKSRDYNEDTKYIVKKILNNFYPIEKHNHIMNDTERTSVGLLVHENIIDLLEYIPKCKSVPFYIKMLDNICFADYIDRITFQKQIWTLNELSSLIKTFYNQFMFHKKFKYKPSETVDDIENIRFTKVLTKYSTEYNNILFVDGLCAQLFMDKKDMLSYFVDLLQKFTVDEIYTLFFEENYEISKLDIHRLTKYLKYYT